MKTAFILFVVALVSVAQAKMAEKVSEDDDFVVYRIPVRDLDLQSEASGMHEGGLAFGNSYGRSSSKSSSSSKSQSQSTGSGKGKGYGEGSSSAGHGTGHGGSSSGHGYGSGGSGYGSGGSGGSGYGSGGSGGSGYGSGGSGYGSGGSGGSGYGSGGSGYGSGGRGYGHGGSEGYGQGPSEGYGQGQGGSGYGQGQGQASYTPGYEGPHSSSNHYDDDEGDHPKITTTTKTFTTNSAQDTGAPQSQYRQIPDSVGDLHFRLADYLKTAPGHEGSSKYSQKLFEGYEEAGPSFRSAQNFNVNAFTRALNQGMGGYKAPSYRNNRYLPQASFVVPTAYALRHVGFGLGGF
ncbi:uncharacterized protein CDAR_501061 [Caerostris darwini]|uniref:Uncharacterized protein n=1 Tax=Caerostris darwini TaxID=1538125 RepID=A0AAV4PKI4_9ARAC|nr:uncharacterized protein CDAR_501061 [Caerostris darwini]